MAGPLPVAIRFSVRRRDGEAYDVIHIFNGSRDKVFSARCERGLVSSFLERLEGLSIRRSSSGKTLYLDGEGALGAMRRLVILAGCRQCTKSARKAIDLAEAVLSIGEYELIFWSSKMLEAYEFRGFWDVCRTARAFRVLYRID
ncbi:hypothetical protein IOK49_01850 [Fervidicoccus fontis]|uniref:Uncharacterized protein n=1 Tax=Fervidicoccus fontis TaxID=683846 RepID=A0A843AGV3_9CREN|nr:hypothetical protein [Fervidicoccus fontis]MBE9390829.1 hypothetical protein [Fervidicoccus fontis]